MLVPALPSSPRLMALSMLSLGTLLACQRNVVHPHEFFPTPLAHSGKCWSQTLALEMAACSRMLLKSPPHPRAAAIISTEILSRAATTTAWLVMSWGSNERD
jgi:hypothetical protein